MRHGTTLPSIGIPGVFMKMNSILQDSIQGMNLRDLNPDLPDGIVEVKEGFLKSKPIPKTNKSFISGRFDILSNLGDGTYAVIDFKITDPKEDKIQKFSHQLHAYKFSLENPIDGQTPKKVSRLGLITVSPQEIAFHKGHFFFRSKPQWFEIKEDMDGFFSFIDEVTNLLDSNMPDPSVECAWCVYRKHFEPTAEIKKEDLDELPF